MNTILNYFIEANVGVILFLLVYRILLKDETNFSFRRYYLLVSLAISLVFPLITISAPSAIPALSQMVPAYWLPELTIGDSPTATVSTTATVTIWSILSYVYLVGSLFFIIKLVLEIYHLLRLSSKSEQHEGILYVDSTIVAFSFFQFIFIGKQYATAPADKAKIIDHERVHQWLGHSYDIVAIELIRIVFWFNPIISLYKKEIGIVHEFQADEHAVQDTQEIQKYCSLLARVALKSADFSLANHFNNSLTLKRINMMNTTKRKLQNWKVAALVPMLAGFFFLVACQDQIMGDIKDASKTASMTTEYPAEVQKRVQELQNQNPAKKYIVMLFDSEDYAKMKNLEASGASDVSYFEVMKIHDTDFEKTGKSQSYVILEKSNQTEQLAEVTKTNDEVFLVVEETATPAGGMTAYYEKIGSMMTYPSQARGKGIEGRVFVEFVVNTDGTLTDVKVLRGIGEGCDEEALRVVKEAGLWIPGKQKGKAVKQRMVMPINFSLGS